MNYKKWSTYKLPEGWRVEAENGEQIAFSIPKEANAHLIAAAPDMYEALKALVKYHEREGKAIPCLVDATEALAKAEVKDDNILR